MPTFTAISHLDLTVSDVERSAAWYVETLGLRRLGRKDFEDRIMVVLHHSNERPGGLIIGLNQHRDPAADRFSERAPGLDHVGFEVTERAELDDWESHLATLGVDHSPVTDSAAGTALVFRDPDNIQLEFWWPHPRG